MALLMIFLKKAEKSTKAILKITQKNQYWCCTKKHGIEAGVFAMPLKEHFLENNIYL